MKKLLTTLICALSLVSYGQTNLLDLGVEGGVSLASLRGNEIIKKYHSSRIGYSGGLFVQFNLSKFISLKTGGYFERKGSSFEFPASDINGTVVGTIPGKENFDYLTVPLLLKASFGKKLKFTVNTGPFIGLLIQQSQQTESVQDFQESHSVNTQYYQKTEGGISFGLGLVYTLKEKFALSFEARNNLGLTDTSKLPVYGNGEIKTNALNFLIGFTYKHQHRKKETK